MKTKSKTQRRKNTPLKAKKNSPASMDDPLVRELSDFIERAKDAEVEEAMLAELREENRPVVADAVTDTIVTQSDLAIRKAREARIERDAMPMTARASELEREASAMLCARRMPEVGAGGEVVRE